MTEPAGVAGRTQDIAVALAALAEAVQIRIPDISRMVVERWVEVKVADPVDEEAREDMAKFATIGSEQVCQFLITGRFPASTGAAEATGRRVAANNARLANSLKIYLLWRDGLLDAFRQEAARLASVRRPAAAQPAGECRFDTAAVRSGALPLAAARSYTARPQASRLCSRKGACS